VALVTGSAASLVDVRSAAERIQSDARMIVMRADESADASTRQIAGLTVLTVPTLKDLGHVVWKAART
jgi:hypothetical protein